MRSTRIIMTFAALIFLSLSVQAQNPITRRIKRDTTQKKSEVILTKGEEINRGATQQQASPQKQFNLWLEEAEKAGSFSERRELLLKARTLCFDKLKNDCKDIIDDKLRAAYSVEISRLLTLASRSNQYNDKMRWLNEARALSEASFAGSNDRSQVNEAYKKEYRQFLENGSDRSYDITRRMGYLRSALRFCQDYSATLGISDCNANITTYAQMLFNDAIAQNQYDKALEVCQNLPGLYNCQTTIYQAQFDDLVKRAMASSSIADQKKLLEQARDICVRYLNNSCAHNINTQLKKIYTLELDRLLQKARSSRDLRTQLQYFADAEALCGGAHSPDNCQGRINEERNQAFNSNFNTLLQDISRTNDYERQKALLIEAERLIAKGQLSDQRWEEIRKVKNQIHYNQLEYLLFQKGSFESQMKNLEQAEAINKNYLNYSYNHKIQERRVVLITEEINAVLRYADRPFQERIERLDYAAQLTNQLERRHQSQLFPRINKERTRIVLIEYDNLVQAARSERHLDKKVSRYEEALQFCAQFTPETASRGGCEGLERERREVVSDVYHNMIADAQNDIRIESFDRALNTLSLASEVYQKYGNDLSREMPISAAYQKLYNQYLASSKNYAARGDFEKARNLLQAAQQLEGNHYWVVATNNPIEEQLNEIDRLELDQKLNQLEQQYYDAPRIINTLDLLQESCQLFSNNQHIYAVNQSNRLRGLYTAVIEKAIQQGMQEINAKRYTNARINLRKIKAITDAYDQAWAVSGLNTKVINSFYQYYSVQMDEVENLLRIESALSNATVELDQIYAQMKEDHFIRQVQGLENRLLSLYRTIFDRHQNAILAKISRNDFYTEALERNLEGLYQSHTDIFTRSEFEQASSGIAFSRNYHKAGLSYQQQQYRQSVEQWNEAINLLPFAPPAYQRNGLAEELKRKRNDAYQAEVNRQIKVVRQEIYEQDRIEGYRSIQRFLDTYKLPLSAFSLQDIKELKEEIFGTICVQRSQQFYFKMESGDDALNRNDYTAALQFYREAKDLAAEFPECGMDISMIQSKINNYESASIFQKRKIELDQLQDRVYTSKSESDFKAYQEAYQSLHIFYMDNIMNKGFHLNLVPYQKKVVQIRNNDFWSYIVWSQCTDRSQLTFIKDLLSELIQDNSFSQAGLEQLASKMATQNFKVFGGKNYKDTFQYYEQGDLTRDKRFKTFKKAYKKQYKRVS